MTRTTLFTAFAIAIGLLLATATAASAYVPTPARQAPTIVTSGYTGWGYTTGIGPDAENVWRWNDGAWESAKLKIGSFVYVYPFGGSSTWKWAWKGNRWYAVQRSRIARWTCTAPAGKTATVRSNSTEAHDRLELTHMGGGEFDRFGITSYLRAGQTVNLACANTIANPFWAPNLFTNSGYVAINHESLGRTRMMFVRHGALS